MLILSFIEAVAKAGEKLTIITVDTIVSISSGADCHRIQCDTAIGAEMISGRLDDLYLTKVSEYTK